MRLQVFFKALEEEYKREFIGSSFTEDKVKLAIKKQKSDAVNFFKARFSVFDVVVLFFFLGFFMGYCSRYF
jgi:hypothetical protein